MFLFARKLDASHPDRRSQCSKIHARHEIRGFFSHLGLPTLFFTFNPSATHSPIFQVIFGYHDIDLESEHPLLPDTRSTRARNAAKDPVAAADFFDFMRTCLFADLFGWDFKAAQTKPEGGIFGKLRAHYGATELTERAQFHGHYLIWLCGALNPSEVHALMRESDEYRDRFFSFFLKALYTIIYQMSMLLLNLRTNLVLRCPLIFLHAILKIPIYRTPLISCGN